MYMQLSTLEEELSDEFRDEHWKSCNSNSFYMIDRSGGLGWTVIIHCKGCHIFEDITDVGSW